jgi:ribosomal protein L37AE/L43A
LCNDYDPGSQIAISSPRQPIFLMREERIMDCPKCKGLMMLERFSDFFLVFYAWKCVNCGAIIDKTICNNRKNSLAAKAAKEAEPASV